MLFIEHKIIKFFENCLNLSINSNIRFELKKHLALSICFYFVIFSVVCYFIAEPILSVVLLLVISLFCLTINKITKTTSQNFSFIFSLSSIIYPIVYLLHLILPKRIDRELEVAAFIQAQVEHEEYAKRLFKELTEDVSAPKKMLTKYINSINDDLNLFVKENFKQSKALTRYVSEHIKNEDGDINDYLVFFILLIPHRKTMEFDNIRAIIQSALQHSENINIFSRHDLVNYIEKPDIVSEKFKLYSVEKIKSLLTKPYSPEEFCRFISIVILGEELNIESKTISAIIKTKAKKVFNDKLFLLEQVLGDIEFRVLSNYHQYEVTKKDFKNCIISYFERDYDIVTCYKNKEPVACISIKDKKIIEIKAPDNRELGSSSKMEIVSLIEKNLYD